MNFCVMSLGQEEKSLMITEQQLEDAAIGCFSNWTGNTSTARRSPPMVHSLFAPTTGR